MCRSQVKKSYFKLRGLAAQHAKHGIKCDGVATVLEGLLSNFARSIRETSTGKRESLPNCGSSVIVDGRNSSHDDCLEQLPATDSPVSRIREGRRVVRPTAPIFRLRFPR